MQDFVFFFKVGERERIFAESHFYGEGRSAEFFDEPILKAAACGNLLGKGYVVALACENIDASRKLRTGVCLPNEQ